MLRKFLDRLRTRTSDNHPRQRSYTRLRLEVLEDRCVPTITTSFNAGTGALTITGDAGTNILSVTENGPTTGSYRVAATDGITGGVNPLDFTGVKSIAIDTLSTAPNGNDRVDLFGDSSARSFLSGALRITGAGGLVVFINSDVNVSGAVNVSKTTNVGTLTVLNIATVTNVTLGPTTITNTGTGATRVDLAGATRGDVGIGGALSTTMGSGSSILMLKNVTVAGGLTHSGTNINARITLVGLYVGSFVSLNGTAADSGISANVTDSRIGSFFSVASGNTDDLIVVDNTSVLGLGLIPQQQTFGLNLRGGGQNTSKIGTAGPALNNVIHGSLFHFGAAVEEFRLENYAVHSFVTINGQGSGGQLNAHIGASKISGFLSLVSAAIPFDTIGVTETTIGQNVAVNLAGGTNFSTISDCRYLGSYSHIDSGNNTIGFTGNTGFGDVRFTGNSLRINPGSFKGNELSGNCQLTSTGSGANDTINLGANLNATLGTPPAPDNLLSVGKTLTIDVGSGASDEININNVIVKGDLIVAANATAPETVRITNGTVGGNLSIDVGMSTAGVSVEIGTTAATNTGAVHVVGTLAVTTGSGLDDVALTDVTVIGTSTVVTRAGADKLKIEGSAGNVGPSQFFGAVSVDTGADNDTITVGFDSANQARFYGAVLFDGGTGTDTLIEAAPQYYGGEPTRSNIP